MPSSNSKPTMQNGNDGTSSMNVGTNGNGTVWCRQQQQRHQQECCSAIAVQQNGTGSSNHNGGSQHQPHHSNGHHGHRQPTAVVSLNPRQVDRLRSVLGQEVQIHGRENFPTLEIPLLTLIVNVRRKLREANLPLRNVKLNGGAASFVFAQSDSFPYSDVDLIFPMDLQEDQDFDRVRNAVFDALLEMMPSSTNKSAITADTLRDVYIRKMVKVADGDRWSLFSLHNDYGRCIELKFVERMRRQFEFSVDSFQITLDSLIDQPNEQRPNIRAESMYGDFMQSLYHLNKRLIDTRSPEEIRGGGLLKYCHLLTRGFSATANCRDMEKYMCSRFFIDFPDINVQEMKLLNYLQNHFGNEDELKFEYLHKLFCVIRDSTVCLMYHERRQTLAMVDRLRQQLSYNLMIYYQQLESTNSNTAAHHQQQQYYGQQMVGIAHNGSGGARWRRYGNSQRYWQNSNRNNRSNGMNTAGPMLCVSPVSTIASSSIVEEEQKQQQQQHAQTLEAIENGTDDKDADQREGQNNVGKAAQEGVEGEGRKGGEGGETGEQKQRKKCANNAAAADNGTVASEQSQPTAILMKQQKKANDNGKQPQPIANPSAQQAAHIPRQTLLYLPPNSSQWIPVV